MTRWIADSPRAAWGRKYAVYVRQALVPTVLNTRIPLRDTLEPTGRSIRDAA